jgi:predicted amidophosphoribosyltransferase
VFCPPPPIVVARAPFLFRGPVRAAVHKLKFAGWRSVAEALGRAMAAANAFDAQVVTWVPVSVPRRARRGYDQAGALACVVGAHLGPPAVALLRRVGDAQPQARRGGAQRRAAMRGAFRALGEVPERVLLVDDVLTTGATAGECARVLWDAGARDIGLLTAARSVPGRLPARYTRRGSRPGLWLPGESSPVVDASRGRNDPRKATSRR